MRSTGPTGTSEWAMPMTDPTGSAGRGRLAEVLATRGGRAEPEAPFVIEHREALIYMLCEAAEVEHGLMCQYLFAAFSLKQRTDEGRRRVGWHGQAARRWCRFPPSPTFLARSGVLRVVSLLSQAGLSHRTLHFL
jgi:Ferritin-like